ncbi:MAG: glycosyltransferase family 39 protein [Tepidisphaeraceae bacterium]
MEDTNLLAFQAEASTQPEPRPSFRPLQTLVSTESRQSRLIAGGLAVAFTIAYFWFLLQYWAPAHNGVDQNGYLVGGRMLAAHGTTGFLPKPMEYIGDMWVLNDKTGYVYPKYPVGLPLLYAVCLWTFGSLGVKAAFLVSPIGAAMSVLGIYCLTRKFAGTFASLMAMLVLAFGQVMLVLANNPNSHASCLAFGIWGMYFLVAFWESGSLWRGLAGGFCLGYAVTIRYTEGLNGLMIGVVVLSSIVYSYRRGYHRALAPVLGWLIPVGYLVGFNLVAMGTLTGYDTTNESEFGAAFTWPHIVENWDKTIRQLHDLGLFFVLPLGLLGMGLALKDSFRRGSMLWLWFIPGTLLYTSYYWAPERGVSFLRFFLTLMPPIIVGVGVLIDHAIAASLTRWQRFAAPAACGFVVAFACVNSLYRGLLGIEEGQESGVGMESQFRQQLNLAGLTGVVQQNVPNNSVLIAAGGMGRGAR